MARGDRLRALALIFIATLLLANAIIGDGGVLALRRARHERREAAAALQAIRDRNAALRREAERLQSDPLLIEAIAREELGLARPGERVVFFVR